VVMFIFLFLTFAAVLSFMKIVSDRTTADSAEVLAMQITEAIQTTILTPSISSEITVPLPPTLPEKAVRGRTPRPYTVRVQPQPMSQPTALAIAIGWGDGPPTYVAASSVQLSDFTYSNDPFNIFSGDYSYIVVNKTDSSLCIQGCEGIFPKTGCEPAC
jgi:hypothetical protein